MVTLAHSAGAEIVFVRPACKLLHCSPFKSVPSDQFAGEKRCLWHQQLQQGQSHLRDGDYAKALEVLSLAAKADDRSAELHYLIGETLFASGQYEEANAVLILRRGRRCVPAANDFGPRHSPRSCCPTAASGHS